MERVATGTKMREMDSIAINQRKIPGIVLMERAGRGLTEAILEKLEKISEKNSCKSESDFCDIEKTKNKIDCLIVCGAGNNGGDGYVSGRHLINENKIVKLYSIIEPEKLSGDAKINYERFTDMGEGVFRIHTEEDIEKFRNDCRKSEIIVDALFGTGISRDIEGKAKQVIDIINEEKKYTISVDIPSGIGADNGKIYEAAIKADKTVTFQMNKYGMKAQPGKEFAGEVTVVDIGIPEEIINENKGIIKAAEISDIVKMIPERNVLMNKGDAGKVLIVAGSKGMAGAAVLAAKAAYRSGAGLVKVAAVWEVIQIIQVAVPEATCLILDEDVNNNIELISNEAKDFDAIVAGPGLGKSESAGKLVKHIIQNISNPTVLDADGLNLIADEPELLKHSKSDIIITPHPAEMGRLIKASPKDVNEDRLNIAQFFASEYNVTLVLKGAGSLIACPDGEIFINTTGNSAMATAGSGDVLSGIIGAFSAAGSSSKNSAIAGVYVHGYSGDLCKEIIGEYGTTASDIATITAEAIKKLKKDK